MNALQRPPQDFGKGGEDRRGQVFRIGGGGGVSIHFHQKTDKIL